MCFDNADDDSTTLRLFLSRGLQHGIGLAHARRHPEENLQFATVGGYLFALHTRENRIWIRPFGEICRTARDGKMACAANHDELATRLVRQAGHRWCRVDRDDAMSTLPE